MANSTHKYIRVKDYDFIADVKREKKVGFVKEGYYDGEWVLVTYKGGYFHIYVGPFGSCEGCDFLLMWAGYDGLVEYEDALGVAESYYRGKISKRSVENKSKGEIIGLLSRKFGTDWYYHLDIPEIIAEIILDWLERNDRKKKNK